MNKAVYVKNTGTAPVTLSMSNTNWNPTDAYGALSLDWNRESTVLNPDQVTTATLTLSTSSSVNGISAFSVNIVISGTS